MTESIASNLAGETWPSTECICISFPNAKTRESKYAMMCALSLVPTSYADITGKRLWSLHQRWLHSRSQESDCGKTPIWPRIPLKVHACHFKVPEIVFLILTEHALKDDNSAKKERGRQNR